MRKHILAGFLIATQLSLGLSAALVAQADSLIIISAVQITGGVGKTAEDFIELYNPGNEAFNLKGYRLVKRSSAGTADSLIKSWTEDTFIRPHGFFLWANNEFAGIAVTPDLTSTATLADNNGVAIRLGPSDTGTIVDSIAWGTTTNGFANVSVDNPGAGESLARVNLFDSSLGYAIGASSPRNSTFEFLPPNPGPTPTPSATPSPSVTPTLSATPTPMVTPTPTPTTTPTPSVTPTPTSSPTITSTPTPSPTGIATTVRINELLPDPTGSDTGTEKVELFNHGNTSINLAGWILDDISSGDVSTANAYVLPSAVLNGQSYIVITVPTGKFGMNNTGGDVVTLLSPDKKLVSTTFYEGTAQEGKSFSYFTSGWKWADLTLGAANIAPTESVLEPFELVITEVYAFPDAQEKEFVELYNPGESSADLNRVTIVVGDRSKSLSQMELVQHELDAGEFLIIEASDLPIALRNSGQTIKLFRDQTIELDGVAYPKSKRGESYSLFEDSFLWTASVTAGQENELLVPTPTATPKLTTVQPKKISPATNIKDVKVASDKSDSDDTTPAIAGVVDKNQSPPNSPTDITASDRSGKSWAIIFAIGALVVGSGMLVVYKYGLHQPQVNF